MKLDSIRYISIAMTVLMIGLLIGGAVLAQDPPLLPTSTPIQVQLASITPVQDVPTPTATLSDAVPTSTPQDVVLIEALSEVNVRSSPEVTEDNRIGSIRAGERYVVLGQYFNWVQFQYDQVPSNRGWVYRDLIEIIQGDEASIPVIEVNATPTLDPQVGAATQTREAILAAPGGALTVTAQSRILQLPGVEQGSDNEVVVPSNGTVLPTYTFPPNISLRPTTSAETDNALVEAPVSGGSTPTGGGVPPIIPIVTLSFFGIAGLALSVFRG